ncbi:MAG: ABC transporter ATP-binding protein [Chitinispirillaceae bacterium]|nr:ABC transporter ATP-binding protein [Chitinispirillaceae bacterium]
MIPVIVAYNLKKSFGSHKVINDLSLTLPEKCVFGLVGLNGAGKTTLLRLLLGILKADSGTIEIMGKNPIRHESDFYKKCGVVLESDGFWGNLDFWENCLIYAKAKGISERELRDYLDRYWKDTEIFSSKKKIKYFSRGQRMQCALCRAFMGNPSVLFLDEPAIALDLNAYTHFKNLVIEARNRGATIIISSHQLDTIDELCDRVGILKDGKLTELRAESEKEGLLCWFIRTENNEYYDDIIKQNGGIEIKYENGWHFKIKNSEQKIPEIVRELVENGCRIMEVRCKEFEFSDAIKDIYKNKG